MADDLGFGDLGIYSNGAVETPNIDSLAAAGLTLTQHYTASPICAPARAAFLTGRYPHRSGVIDTFPHRGLDALSLREQTIADILSAGGYRTGLVGKWHNGTLGSAYHPNRRGFNEFVGFRGGVQDYWDWRLERNGVPYSSDGRYLTDVLTDEAIQFVQRHHRDPFFLFLAYTAPHGPFQVHDHALHAVRRRRGAGPIVVDTIAAMVEVMDLGIGQLLDVLDGHGVAENTLVLFTSDNGPWMRPGGIEDTTIRYNLGLAGGKELVLEGGIRVPAVIRWASHLPSGSVSHIPVHFTDWTPTLSSIAGEAPTGLSLDGVDVSPLLRGGSPRGVADRYWQWSRYSPLGTVNAAAREGVWKLVYPADERALLILDADREEERRLRLDPDAYVAPSDGFPEPPPFEDVERAPMLYNLARDPGETLDLASLEAERTRRMVNQLNAWFAEVEAERSDAILYDRRRGTFRS